MSDLTSTQLRYLTAIRDITRKQGYPPSLSEIAERMGVRSSAVSYNIKNLTEKGYLEPWNGPSRKTRLTAKAHDLFIEKATKKGYGYER